MRLLVSAPNVEGNNSKLFIGVLIGSLAGIAIGASVTLVLRILVHVVGRIGRHPGKVDFTAFQQ